MTKSRKLSSFSILLILSLMISITIPAHASAQSGDGIKRSINPNSGRVSFIAPDNAQVIPATDVLSTVQRQGGRALGFAIRFAPEFGLKATSQNLAEIKTFQSDSDHIFTRFQQKYNGIPVLGGELIVDTNQQGDLHSISGEVSPDPSVQTQPTIDSEQAAEFALSALAKWYDFNKTDLYSSDPELWIYDESLLKPSDRPVELVWRMEVSAADDSLPIRELVLVNADTGNISLHFNQVDNFWHTEFTKTSTTSTENLSRTEQPLAVLGSPQVSTYTANNGTSLPGTLLCTQAQPNCTNGSNPHADAAHRYAIGTYNMYSTNHARDSINGAGMTLKSTVHYSSNYFNAFWDGSQMVYGDAAGFPLADDVVAHELTHGVTQYESDLFYYYQSGAINESFSDLWGEYYDQTNGLGNDTVGVKWLLGEDISGYGAIRSMSNPPSYGDPDKMSSANYDIDNDLSDNGGVHSNSGINNKAVYLMVDGDTFNGITVTGLGWTKVEQIYYEVQANLLVSGADYSDLYYALQQACSNLIGQYGITSNDCVEVKDAVDAVEMNGQPEPGFNTNAPYCDSSNAIIVDTLFDDLESGSSNWTFTNGTYTRWQYGDSPYGKYTHSGLYSLYANDNPAATTDATARLTSVVVPQNAYLHFAHIYDFEVSSTPIRYWDGGVIEYSTNGGSTWTDAGTLISEGDNGYDNTIWSSANNPLAGRSAFVGLSHGYISTRLNLSTLAGKSIAFRWRMGLDGSVYSGGWWVDDVRIYQCATPSDTPYVQGIVSPNSRPTLTTTVDFAVTFTGNVTGVDTSDFVLLSPGLTGASIAAVSGSGNSYTVSVNTGTGKGTLHLNLIDNDSIIGQTGIPLGGQGINNGNYLSAETIPIINHSSGVSSSFTVTSKSKASLQTDQQTENAGGEKISNDSNNPENTENNVNNDEIDGLSENVLSSQSPKRTSPAENSTLPGNPIFRWTKPEVLNHYQFQLSPSSVFSTVLFSIDTVENYYELPQIGFDTYYWRIRGADQNGNWSSWSPVYKITITNKTYNTLAKYH